MKIFTLAIKPLFYAAVINFLLLSTPAFAGSGGNGDAKKGSALPIILTVAGAGTIAWGVSELPTPFGYVLIAGGIAEIAGAIIAGNNNSKTNKETQGGLTAGLPMPEEGGGGMPSGFSFSPDTNIGDLCAKAAGVCTCAGIDCSQPSLKLPTDINTLKAGLQEAYKNDPNAFDGKSLEDALSGLDNNFANAKKAFDDFNKASEAGTLENGFGEGGTQGLLAGDGSLQGVGNSDGNNNDISKSGKKLQGKGSQNGSSDSASHGDSNAIAATKGTDFSKTNRERPAKVNRHGLVLEDASTGRLLTIFERLTRAIRGEHNRDLTLAKVEWARKDAERKEKNKQNKLGKNTVAASVAPTN